MISKHLVKYVLIAALRDKLMLTLIVMTLMGAAIAAFMGSATVTEGNSFALVFSAGGLRLLGALGLVLFCCFYMRRSFESKEVEFLLSRPISRTSFLFSHALAFSVLALIIASFISVVVWAIGRPDIAGMFVWFFSFAAELAIISVTSLFFSMVLASAAGSALATLGFYALARMIGTVLGIVSLAPENAVMAVMGNVMKIISIVVPRFDIMGQTSWLIYGVDKSVGLKFMPDAGAYAHLAMEHMGLTGFILAQLVVFVSLLLAAATHDFSRRQF